MCAKCMLVCAHDCISISTIKVHALKMEKKPANGASAETKHCHRSIANNINYTIAPSPKKQKAAYNSIRFYYADENDRIRCYNNTTL